MKRLLSPVTAIITVFLLITAPSVLPFADTVTVFLPISELYEALESAARRLIPDEIENIISALNKQLA